MIPSGIAVGALEDTTSGNIQCGNSAEAAKLRRGENFSSSEPWANFAALHLNSVRSSEFGVKSYELRTPACAKRSGEGRLTSELCFMAPALYLIPGCLQVNVNDRGDVEGDELGKD